MAPPTRHRISWLSGGGGGVGFKDSGDCPLYWTAGPPAGSDWAQKVAPGTSSRPPKYRPNPASGDPIGGQHAFWKTSSAAADPNSK